MIIQFIMIILSIIGVSLLIFFGVFVTEAIKRGIKDRKKPWR